MGFLKKLFEKKDCEICGGEIGLLGNTKLVDGDTEKDMIRLVLQEVQIVDSDEPSAPEREPSQLNCAFTWDMDDIYFKLTHVEGDELLDGLWGGTFLFLNEYDFHNVPKG